MSVSAAVRLTVRLDVAKVFPGPICAAPREHFGSILDFILNILLYKIDTRGLGLFRICFWK